MNTDNIDELISLRDYIVDVLAWFGISRNDPLYSDIIDALARARLRAKGMM